MLKYTLQFGLAGECCEATHVRLVMMQSALRADNASSQLASSVKDLFVESSNARKVTRVDIVNPFAFHQLNYPHHSAAKDQ